MTEHMRCPECDVEVTVVSGGGDTCHDTCHYETVDELLDSNKAKHPIPFWCPTCGAIKFPLRPLGDKVFIISDPIRTHLGSGILVIPDEYKEKKRRTGTIVSVGKGYVDDRGKFVAMSLKIGQRVIYHFGVPWSTDAKGQDGKEHRVELMGEKDVQLIIDNEFDESTVE